MSDAEIRVTGDTTSFESAMKRAAGSTTALDAGLRSLTGGSLRLNQATQQLTNSKGRYISAEKALNALGVQTARQLAQEVAAVDALARRYDAASVEGRQLAAVKAQIIARSQGVGSAASASASRLGAWSAAANDAQQFAYGWRQGLIALSNQFPMLIAGMNATGTAGKAMQASLGWITLAVSVAATAAVLFSARQKEATKALSDQAEQAAKTRREIERLSGAQAGARLFELRMEEDRLRQEQAGYTGAAADLFRSGRATRQVTFGGQGVSRTERVTTEAFRAAQAGTARTTRELNENLRLQATLRRTVQGSIAGTIALTEAESEAVRDNMSLTDRQVAAINRRRDATVAALRATTSARDPWDKEPRAKKGPKNAVDTFSERADKAMRDAMREAEDLRRVGADAIAREGALADLLRRRTSATLEAARARVTLNAADLESTLSAEREAEAERARLEFAVERSRIAAAIADGPGLRERALQARLIEGDRLRLQLAESRAAVEARYGAAGLATMNRGAVTAMTGPTGEAGRLARILRRDAARRAARLMGAFDSGLPNSGATLPEVTADTDAPIPTPGDAERMGLVGVNRGRAGAYQRAPGVSAEAAAQHFRVRAAAMREQADALREMAAAASDSTFAEEMSAQAAAADRQARAFDRSAVAMDRVASSAEALSDTLRSSLAEGLASVGDSLGTLVVDGGSLTETLGKVILGGLGDLASQIGKGLIAFGLVGLNAQKAIQAILTPLGPAGAIAAGVAFAALGGALRAGASNIGGGGRSSGGSARVFGSPAAAAGYRPTIGTSSAPYQPGLGGSVPYVPVVALPPPTSWGQPQGATRVTGVLTAGPRGMQAIVQQAARYDAAVSTRR